VRRHHQRVTLSTPDSTGSVTPVIQRASSLARNAAAQPRPARCPPSRAGLPGFRRAVLDDPVNRQPGRVVSYPTAGWDRFEQIGPLLRCGAEYLDGPRLMLPGVGEHPVEILGEPGFIPAEIGALLAAKIARQLESGA
jgi:hypothetical protein